MGKVLFVATVVKGHITKFHIPYLKMFKDMGWATAVAAKNDYEPPEECVIPYCDAYYNLPFERSPFKAANIKAYRELKKLINEGHYDIIHCHTPVGAALTRLAASDARKRGTRVIYTAHGFHFYKGAPHVNWLLYYPVERWLARKTDVLITMNQEDYERAKTFKAGRVEYVPGVGIDIRKFQEPRTSRAEKRKELDVGSDNFTLLSVGELIPRKNHAIVLDALGELKKRNQLNGISYLICGSGPLESELKRKAETLEIAECVRFLGYRSDISDICNCVDLFVFMSLQEGLPVALMEAMACGLPVICSKIRGNADLVDEDGGFLFHPKDSQGCAAAIRRLQLESATRHEMGECNRHKVKNFSLGAVLPIMEHIYRESGLDLNL